MRTVRTAAVPDSRAPELIPMMLSKGIIDRTARIRSENGFHWVPINPGMDEEVE